MGRISPDYRVVSYDISERFYADRDMETGQAAREMLPQELLTHVEFRNPTTAPDVRDDHAPNSLELVFIDADHRHPWPTLDLLAILDVTKPGAQVVMHDINLPVAYPDFQDWGAKHLFDDVACEKKVGDTHRRNIGSLFVPADKEALHHQLRAIVGAHPWEIEVAPESVARALSPSA